MIIKKERGVKVRNKQKIKKDLGGVEASNDFPHHRFCIAL